MIKYLLIGMIALSGMTRSLASRGDPVIWLNNGGTKVGVLPSVGGRVVFLGTNTSGNILKSDSSLWDEPASERPVPGFN
jgi:hypothetical protein